MNDIIIAIFGDELVSQLSPEFRSILYACIYLLLVWIAIKIFRALGSLF